MSLPDRAFLSGALAGLIAGLLLAWTALAPGQVVLDLPGLKADVKEQWAVLAAMAYATDGDLTLASQRLAALGGDPRAVVAPLAEQYISQLKPEAQRRSLARLALALGSDSINLRVYAVTPASTSTPQSPARPAVTTATTAPSRLPSST